jgi:hypothetical protein
LTPVAVVLLLQGEESGERSMVLVMGGFYLLFAMMVLVVDEDTLETGLTLTVGRGGGVLSILLYP